MAGPISPLIFIGLPFLLILVALFLSPAMKLVVILVALTLLVTGALFASPVEERRTR